MGGQIGGKKGGVMGTAAVKKSGRKGGEGGFREMRSMRRLRDRNIEPQAKTKAEPVLQPASEG